ncbi:aromatic-ring-hydroxylating dioxygenase subunit beta [Neobacillus sp. NPDC097160]|uniref:aromatic-ring-hydroxylating dioxygenase subunit beta n=1 Tax=Neobacillus sp. NPDC097160 TaxID=3364298 RepID=UPI00380980EC
MKKSLQEIEDFLYHEAELLDEWKLEEWAALFSSEGMYLIPPIGNPNADHNKSVYFAHDDRDRLEQRAKRLLKREAHVEYPHSTTVRNLHNIRIKDLDEQSNSATVRCNFTTYRTKREKLDCFVGVLEYILVLENNELKIKEKKVILKLDSLRPQGKISIIL